MLWIYSTLIPLLIHFNNIFTFPESSHEPCLVVSRRVSIIINGCPNNPPHLSCRTTCLGHSDPVTDARPKKTILELVTHIYSYPLGVDVSPSLLPAPEVPWSEEVMNSKTWTVEVVPTVSSGDLSTNVECVRSRGRRMFPFGSGSPIFTEQDPVHVPCRLGVKT